MLYPLSSPNHHIKQSYRSHKALKYLLISFVVSFCSPIYANLISTTEALMSLYFPLVSWRLCIPSWSNELWYRTLDGLISVYTFIGSGSLILNLNATTFDGQRPQYR